MQRAQLTSRDRYSRPNGFSDAISATLGSPGHSGHQSVRVSETSTATPLISSSEASLRPPVLGSSFSRTRPSILNVMPSWASASESKNAGFLISAGEKGELAQVYRAHRVVSATERVTLWARDEETLLTDPCRAVVEAGGCQMAWIGYAAHDKRKRVQTKAYWGGATAHLERRIATSTQNALSGTPAGTAIRVGMPIVVEVKRQVEVRGALEKGGEGWALTR